MTTIITNAF